MTDANRAVLTTAMSREVIAWLDGQSKLNMPDKLNFLISARQFRAALTLLAEAREALEAALPRIAHPPACWRINPTEEWAEKGSWSIYNCSCESGIVESVLNRIPAAISEVCK